MKIFVKRPRMITNEEMLENYQKLREGDEKVREFIINGNIPQALFVARYTTPTIDLYQEFVAEGLLKLVEAVDAIISGAIDHHNPPNIRGYITTVLSGHLRKYRYKCLMMYTDPTTERKDSLIITVPTVRGISKDNKLGELILQETIDTCLTNETERFIFQSRLKGDSDPIIAAQLNCSVMTVNNTRRAIGERLKWKLNNGQSNTKS